MLLGIQYAGSHLKELQKAFKNPTANLGLIFKESSKRAFQTFGIGGVDMTNLVELPLVESAKICGECTDLFAKTVETLLVKYGKDIVNEQMLLNRLADSAIDIYSMVCVLSRASNSIKGKLPSVDHELLMTQSWVLEASDRVKINLRKVKSNDFIENYKRLSLISQNVCKVHDVVQNNPINV